MQITDLFGAAAAFETVRMPDGTEAAIPTEHAAVIYVNEQPAFRVVCTPQLLPQLALGRQRDHPRRGQRRSPLVRQSFRHDRLQLSR